MPQDAAAAASKLLFIDDADISSMDGVERRIHPARKHEGNPVVASDNDWEASGLLLGTVRKEGDRYRMWYQSRATTPGANKFDSYVRFLLLYAESEDGLTWTKPALGSHQDPMGTCDNNIAFVRPGLTTDMNANVLYAPQLAHGSAYTMLTYGAGYNAPYNGYIQAFSEDGTGWTDGPKTPVIPGYGDVGCLILLDTVRNCAPLEGRDARDHKLQWRDADARVSGDRQASVRLRLRDAEVFSLWWE